MVKIAAILLFFVTFSLTALMLPMSAQAQDQGSFSESTAAVGGNTAVIVDIGAILNKGFGIGFIRNLNDSITGHVHYSKQTLDSDDEEENIVNGYSAEHRIEQYGVRFDYYFKSVYASGFYIGAGVVQTNLETKVDPIFTNDKRTLKDDELGGQAFAGYHLRSGALGLKIGLGYGSGSGFSNNLGGTKNEIESGLLLDSMIAFSF